MEKLKQITLLPFNMAIYKRLWDNKLIDNTIFDRNGKYIKNNKIYISDKAYGELIMYSALDKYLIPHKIPEGFIEVELVDNARIEEISDGGYEEAYGSDADSLIVNDILVY